MALLFYLSNTVAMLAFGGAVLFAVASTRAGASIHPHWPTSILVFFFVLPALAFLVAMVVAWRCTRGTTSQLALVVGVACAAMAALATAGLLAFAVELTLRREMPDAVPWLVGTTLVALASLPVASAVNLAIAARELVGAGRSI